MVIKLKNYFTEGQNMKQTKRLISVIVAMLMVLTVMMPMASAADFSDVATDYKYYQAISNLSAYGILDGMGDGTFRPEDKVTRAQFAKIICYALNIGEVASGNVDTGFTDVDPSHWAAGNIKMAAARGIINGMGDGTFAPESNIKYEQAVKMIVCALGYGARALEAGPYPIGYMSVAAELKLLKGVAVDDNKEGTDATRGTIAKLVDTMINTDQLTTQGTQGSSLKDQTVKTINENGQVIAVYGSTILVDKTSDCSRNQIEIKVGSKTKKYDISDLDSVKSNAGDYLGKRVTVYYSAEEEDESIPTLKNLTLQAKKNVIVEVDLADIEEINDNWIEYTSDIETGDTEEVTVASGANILKNGVATDKGLSELIKLNEESGQITFIDSDANGDADVVFVKSYVTFIVTSVVKNDFKLYGKDIDPLVLDEKASNITIKKNGKASEFKNINKDDIVSYAASTDMKVIDVLVSNKVVNGTVSLITTNGNITIKSSSGTDVYKKSLQLDDDSKALLEVGTTGKFFIDAFNKIAKIDASSDVAYTYAYITEFGNIGGSTTPEYAIKAIKVDGATTPKSNTYKFATKFKIDGESYSDSDDEDTIKDALNTSASHFPGFDSFTPDKSFSQVIKFTTNSSGKIDRIYTVDYPANDDNKLKTEKLSDIKCTESGSLLDSIYSISGAKVLVLTEDKDTGVDKISGSPASYFKKSNKTKYNVVLIDLNDDSKATIVVAYGNPTDDPDDNWEDCPPMIVTNTGESVVEGRDDAVAFVTVMKHTGGDTVEYFEGVDAEGVFSQVKVGDIIQIITDGEGNAAKVEIRTTVEKMLSGSQSTAATIFGDYEKQGEDYEANNKFRLLYGTVRRVGTDSLTFARTFGAIDNDTKQDRLAITDNTKVILVNSEKLNEGRSGISESVIEEVISAEAQPDNASKVVIYTSGNSKIRTIYVFK